LQTNWLQGTIKLCQFNAIIKESFSTVRGSISLARFDYHWYRISKRFVIQG